METRFRVSGMTATIRRLRNGFILTFRDERGHMFRRRRHGTWEGATDELMAMRDAFGER